MSADIFLGVPYNIASYALLTHILARIIGLEPDWLVHTVGDLHLYKNHIAQAKEQLIRVPLFLPTLKITRAVTDPAEYQFEDFVLTNYYAHPNIPAPVAV